MAYKITYTKRFEKHYRKLSATEKMQIKSKVEMLSEKRTVPGALAITERRNTPLSLFSNLFSNIHYICPFSSSLGIFPKEEFQ